MIPIKARKKERRNVCHVIYKLADARRRKDISTLPLRLDATVLWKERVGHSVAKIVEGKNIFVDFLRQTNAGAHKLHLLH